MPGSVSNKRGLLLSLFFFPFLLWGAEFSVGTGLSFQPAYQFLAGESGTSPLSLLAENQSMTLGVFADANYARMKLDFGFAISPTWNNLTLGTGSSSTTTQTRTEAIHLFFDMTILTRLPLVLDQSTEIAPVLGLNSNFVLYDSLNGNLSPEEQSKLSSLWACLGLDGKFSAGKSWYLMPEMLFLYNLNQPDAQALAPLGPTALGAFFRFNLGVYLGFNL